MTMCDRSKEIKQVYVYVHSSCPQNVPCPVKKSQGINDESTGQADDQETSPPSLSYPCFSVAGTLNVQVGQLQPKDEQFVSNCCMLQLPLCKLASVLLSFFFFLISFSVSLILEEMIIAQSINMKTED